MNIKELSKEIYDQNCKSGFWKFVNGIRQERNVGEMLMLVISELSEALEADRKKRYADLNTYRSITLNGTYTKNEAFLECIKDSVSDELADVAIRLMDIAYGLDMDLETEIEFLPDFTDNTAENLLLIAGCLTLAYRGYRRDEQDEFEGALASAFQQTQELARGMNIDLEWHISSKMRYNATRPFMHNKEY